MESSFAAGLGEKRIPDLRSAGLSQTDFFFRVAQAFAQAKNL
jgi:hypothetical protein